MVWIFYSLLAALLWAIVNVTDKYTMSKLVDNPLVPILILSVVGLVVATMVCFTHGLARFTVFNLFLAGLAGLFYVLTMLFYYLSLKHDEVSKVIPIYYFSIVFIILIAKFFLNESLTSSQYVGIAFLVSGAVLISLPSPMKLGVSRGVWFMLLAAFCYALNQVLTKYLLKNNDLWSVFAYIRLTIFFSLLPVFFWNLAKIIDYCKKINYRAYSIMTANQLLNVAGVFAITTAMTMGYVTLVNALASVQPFFVLMLTIIAGFFLPGLLQEQLSGLALIKKFLAICLIFIGVLFVS